MMLEALIDWAHQRGYKVGFTGVSLLETVREKLAKRREKGEFVPGFFEENLGVFTYLERVSMRRPESTDVSFTREETLALLENRDFRDEDVARSIQAKFGVLALSESVSIYRRNLRQLLRLKSKGRDLLSGGQGI